MVAYAPCASCAPTEVLGVKPEPIHCYGTGDRPAPRGVLGGFRCSCECRHWKREDRD